MEAGGDYESTDQEERCEKLFQNLEKMFKKLEKASKPGKIHSLLKDITNMLKECKALVKDFEREARTDGMPATELNERRKRMVNQVNRFIAAKKNYSHADGARGDLLNGAQGDTDPGVDNMNVQQLMSRGRKEMAETDEVLHRAEKIVSDTLEVGKTTASTLHGHTEKLNSIVDELNEIEFNMKKATKVIRDITKGLLTDKCIGFLLFLIVGGVITVVVLKIVKPNQSSLSTLVPNISNITSNWSNIASNLTGTITGALGNRRFLLEDYHREKP